MDGFINVISWSPSGIASGSFLNGGLLIILVMSFIGASIVTRVAKINTSFNFSINFLVMLAGCLMFNSYASELLLPFENEFIASAVAANFGMTVAGCALLFGYRKTI
ncbi:MAG: hypothetical protein ACR2OM_05175 [Aestuariivirgaceae bacterium]